MKRIILLIIAFFMVAFCSVAGGVLLSGCSNKDDNSNEIGGNATSGYRIYFDLNYDNIPVNYFDPYYVKDMTALPYYNTSYQTASIRTTSDVYIQITSYSGGTISKVQNTASTGTVLTASNTVSYSTSSANFGMGFTISGQSYASTGRLTKSISMLYGCMPSAGTYYVSAQLITNYSGGALSCYMTNFSVTKSATTVLSPCARTCITGPGISYTLQQSGDKTATVTLPKPTRAGYKFAGWYTSRIGGKLVKDSFFVASSRTVYAHWVENNGNATLPTSTKITAYRNSGTETLPRTNQISNISLSYYGYGFAINSNGYLESQNAGVNNSYSMVCIRFSAKASSTFTIQYISYGESNYDYAIFSNLDQALSESYSADTTYYKRTYGEASSAVKTLTYSGISSGSHEIYIKFRKDGSTHSYNDSLQLWFGNDWFSGTTTAEPYKVHFVGMRYGALPTMSRTGYTFNGWYTAETGGTQITESSIFNSSSIYPHWTVKSYTLYLDANGGSSTRSFGVSYGTSSYSNISSYLPTRTGYTFLGFTNSPSGGTYVYDANGAYTGNYVSGWGNYLYSSGTLVFDGTNGQYIYIYAQWKVNTYNVTLNANNGEIYIPLSEWELTGGATYNSSTGEIYLPNIDSRAYSPLIYVGDTFVNSTLSWKSTAEFYTNYSASGDMVNGGASYYNESGVNYSGNGWASKVQVGAWTKTDMVLSNSTDWLGADNCQYIRINFGRSDTYAPNPYYFRNVKFGVLDNDNEQKSGKSVTYGSTYGTLPTPTRENYTFGGWKKGQSKQMYNDFSFASSTSSAYNHYQFAKCKPGAKYHIRIKKAEVTDVQSGYSRPTMFSILTYDYTASIGYERQDVYFGEDIELTMTYPSSANPNNDLVLLIYSGIAGSTTGIGTKYSGISIVEETETIVDSSTTYTTAGDEVLFAKWTPVQITNTVHLRVINKDGSWTNADNSNGGYVDVSRWKIINQVPTWQTYTQKDDEIEPYTEVHQGQQFKIDAYANSGYVFAGFSTSSTPSEAIKNPSSTVSTTISYYPTSGTNYYVYFKQVSDNQLKYDEADKYFYFEDGYYPQSEASISSGTATGESIRYNDGKNEISIPIYTNGGNRYARVTKNGVTKWFKFEPIRWRISDYGVAKTERNIAKYTSLYNLRFYTSYSTNFTAVSDLILGVGAMHNTREVNENLKNDQGKVAGYYARELLGYKSVKEAADYATLNFRYSSSTSNIDLDRYGCTALGNGNTVYNSVNDEGWYEKYESPIRLVSEMELATVGFVNRGARASDMVAFILGLDKNQVSYWTRDLSNLGAGVAITPTGTEIRPWLDEMLGMRFAYTFREGSNAGGGF